MNLEVHDALEDEDSDNPSQSELRKGINDIYCLIMGYLEHRMSKVDLGIYNEAKYLRELAFRNGEISDI